MIDFIANNANCDVIRWPNHYLNDAGELSFAAMESRQSVHLRPKFYYNTKEYHGE